ncbi:MAG: Hsp20/alpha crystallin family protein [Nitrospirae bacterium]|nr:Hsp20/alpha crystallin family protein [Nitrospirota bacterium]
MLNLPKKEAEVKTSAPWRSFWNRSAKEREMDRLYREIFEGPWFSFGWPKELRALETEKGALVPRIEVYEDQNDVVVKAELPGMKKEDLEIKLRGDILTIKGEKTVEEKTEKKEYFYSECSYGAFERSIEIPISVLADKITANFKDGLLEIRLRKNEDVKGKEINIKVA